MVAYSTAETNNSMAWAGRPIDPKLTSNIAALMRAELDREATAGFAKLRRIPSTGVIKLLDYLESLPPADYPPLLDALSEVGALCFFPGPLIAEAYEKLRTTNSALLRRAAAMQSPQYGYGLRYVDLRMARTMMKDPESRIHIKRTRAALDFVPRDDPPKELLPEGDIVSPGVETAKAPFLRKLLKQSLVPLLGAKAEKRPGGQIVYDGMIRGVPLKVGIVFSNMYGQMHYAMSAKIFECDILAQRLTYEALWGPNTGWDYLTEENAPRSIELLSDLLRVLSGLMKQIASLPDISG